MSFEDPGNDEQLEAAVAHIDPRFIVHLKGRPYPLFAGVLDAATRMGIKALTTSIVQIPTAENGQMAVVMARLEMEDGRIFEDVGDCSPQTTTPALAAAALRLASTRAKGRVCRDATNTGATLLEELPGHEMAGAKHSSPASRVPAPGNAQAGVRPAPSPAGPAAGTVVRDANPAAGGGGEEAAVCIYADCGQILTKNQLTMSQHKLKLKLCPVHLKIMLEEQQKAQGVG